MKKNTGFEEACRRASVEKRPVRGGIAGRKDYARDKLTNGSKTRQLPDFRFGSVNNGHRG